MSVFQPELAPGWSQAQDLDGPPTYTSVNRRTLQGSELLLDQLEVGHDEYVPCADGSSIDRGTPEGSCLPSWRYSPINGIDDVEAWLEDAFVVQRTDNPPDMDSFILKMCRTTLPYQSSSGKNLHVRVYLHLGPAEHAIYIHGPHSIMDAWPTLGVLDLIFAWMTDDSITSLEQLPWGSEVKNLPVGPVIATGGYSSAWDTEEGGKLLKTVMEAMGIEKTPHTLKPTRVDSVDIGTAVRYRLVLEAEHSQQLLGAAKALGYTPSHLFEAAQMLALVAHNPVNEDDFDWAFIRNGQTFVSLEKDLVYPYKTKPQFISSHVQIPFYFPVKNFPTSGSPKQKLIQTMSLVKSQLESYTNNPCLPQLFARMFEVAPPLGFKIPPHSYGNVFTNLGQIERRLPVLRGRTSEGGPLIEIEDIAFGHRWTNTGVAGLTHLLSPVHVWTMKSQVHIQVQACDNWDAEYLKAYVAKISQQASYILDD
ncbi:hypothetical protein BV22DRAFT_1052056 [Leucogyrophana mollusca]|uniref:Uncharacterized protein n=1 Tax=Leucogyrophana mollusca TaxID=85980 RepID=A0ACB8AXI0_9AGAM|nr:hypothetical protein BV22DRAFT_1052056 [Leucogyrophana mollusca]